MWKKLLPWRTRALCSESRTSLSHSQPLDGIGNKPPYVDAGNDRPTGPEQSRMSVENADNSSAYSFATPHSITPPDHGSNLTSLPDTNIEDSVSGALAGRVYFLPDGHPFQATRSELLLFSYARMLEWMGSVRYDVKVRSQFPPCRPSRSTQVGLHLALLKEEIQSDDDELVVISHQHRQLPFSCPFYASDVEEYRGCLLKDNLQSIRHVVEHLRRHHTKPRYCPRCNETFGRVVDRDRHILQQTCELRDLEYRDGINEYQMAAIIRSDKQYISETMHWQKIYTYIFPDKYPPGSPYLNSGCGYAAAVAWDFWEGYGHQCISLVLLNRGLLGETGASYDLEAQEALFELTLQDLINKAVQEYGHF